MTFNALQGQPVSDYYFYLLNYYVTLDSYLVQICSFLPEFYHWQI